MKPFRTRMIGMIMAAAAWALPATAQDDKTIVSHGISTFGDMKYPADFPHLDYVNPDAPKGGEIALWAQGTFDSMNPYTRKGRAGSLATIFFESLLTGVADEIGASYGLLAETIEYPESKDWVIFTLREQARFSDGSPVTAEDVRFTYELFLSEGLASFRAVLGAAVDGAEVLDDRRIRFTFKDGYPRRDVIETVGGLPIFQKQWFIDNDAGLDESRLEPAIGSGPYMLDSYDVNEQIVYRRNPDYWGADLPLGIGQYNFDTIRVEYFGDSIAAFEGFKAGAYTFRNENSSKTWATGYDFPAINDGIAVQRELPDGTLATGQSFVMNLRRDKFQDIRVREAIGLMFNFEWSNEALFYGAYARIHSFWENSDLAATGVPGADEVAVLQPLVDAGLLAPEILTDNAVMAPASWTRGRDQQRKPQLDRANARAASALLDAAGWNVGDDGMRRKDGQILRVEFLEASPTFDRVVNPFVENLRAIGIDAVYERVDPAQYTDRTRSFDFDIITDQFPMAYEPGAGLRQYFGAETADVSVFNAMGLKDPAVDRLIDIVTKAETQAELTTAVKALDRVLRARKFWVPQWFKDAHTVAYFDMFDHPDPLPPYDPGFLTFWWVDPAKEAALKASGALQ